MLYTRFESLRAREYEERINQVDCGSFTPMIMSSTGGTGPLMQMAIRRPSSLMAEKQQEEYSVVAGANRARFAFAIARAPLVCLRGSRSRFSHTVDQDGMESATVLCAK